MKGVNSLWDHPAQVMRWNDGSWLENQDSWSMSGIFRDVALIARPSTHIRDFFAATSLENDYRDGVLDLTVDLRTFEQTDLGNYRVNYRISKDDTTIQSGSLGGESQSNTLSRRLTVLNPLLWSAEHPSLYTLEISLLDNKQQVLESLSSEIGFRNIELKGGRILLNGYPIVFKGVNLHEFHPETGYVVDEQTMIRDFKLLKEANFNAIRTSHYPQPKRFYELADKFGFYVIAEANLETHLFRFEEDLAPARKPEWAAQMLDRTVRMVEQYKNHPSIVIWSPGNEAGPGPNMVEIYNWAKQRDPSRLFQYADDDRFEGGNFSQLQVRPFGISSDFQTAFYPSPWSMERYAQEQNDVPWVMGEYWHSMGNSLGNGKEFWETIYKHPILQGGFTWDWVDQGLLETDDDGKRWFSHGGDYGPKNVPSSGNFIHNGVVFPDRTVKPAYWEVKKAHQPAHFSAFDLRGGIIAITNRHHFTNLNEFRVRWYIEQDGVTIMSGIEDISSTEPGKTSKVRLGDFSSINVLPNAEFFLMVELISQAGFQHSPLLSENHVFASEQFKLPFHNRHAVPRYAPTLNSLAENMTVQSTDKSLVIKIQDSGASITFNKETGFLTDLEVGSKALLVSPLSPNMWRALTDNDYGFQPRTWDFGWREVRNHTQLIDFSYYQTHQKTVVISTSHLLQDATNRTMGKWLSVYSVNQVGEIKVNSTFQREDGISMPPRVGMRLAIPADYQELTWFGRGPHENYIDRNWSAYVSRYHGTIDSQYVRYLRPQENGYKTDVRWLQLHSDDGPGIRFEFVQGPYDGLGFSAMPNPLEDFEAKDDVWLTATQQNRMKPEMHINDVPGNRNGVFVHIDAIQAGVGGDNSWAKRTHNEFTPRERDYSYTFMIKVVESN